MGVTIKDIAKITNVSYSTVSKALNDSPLVKPVTKNKILKVAAQLGYQPNFAAKRLVSKKSNVIGVLWPTIDRVTLSTLVTKINQELEQRNYSMILSINPIDSAIELFQRFQVDGIIMFDEQSVNQKIASSPFQIPIVSYGKSGNSMYPTIQVNRGKAISLAVDYLYNLGHRRIAYLGDLTQEHVNQQEKYIGFTDAAFNKGLQINRHLVINTGGLEWYQGYDAAQLLLKSSSRPTAIISGSYDITTGIMRAFKERSIDIPNDISLISYDNILQMQDLDVPITAVGAPIDKIAQSIVGSLISKIDGNIIENRQSVNVELVERDSCSLLK